MADHHQLTVEELLTKNLSRDLVLAVEDALEAAARRAFLAASGMRDGHLPNIVGQMRHFHMNEAFADALEIVGASPSPVLGNALVVGRSGIFKIGRFNVNQGPWYNAKRSRLRRLMAEANRSIEHLVQPNLFDPAGPATEAAVFFVTVFSGSMSQHPERPVDIQVAVPDSKMRQWLYCESLSKFMQRYNEPSVQRDEARPVLKASAAKRKDNESGAS